MKRFLTYMVLGAATSLFLQQYCMYDYFYTEQQQGFLWSAAYFRELIGHPGGTGTYIARFLRQFYCLPYAGTTINTGLFLLLIWGMESLYKKLDRVHFLPFLSLSIALYVLVLETDVYYLTEGTLSLLLTCLILNIQLRIKNPGRRLTALYLGTALTFFITGPAAFMVGLCGLGLELICQKSCWWKALGAPLLAILLQLIWHSTGNGESARCIFLPDAYYESYLTPDFHIYLPWIALPLSLLLAYALGKCPAFRHTAVNVIFCALQVTGAFWLGLQAFLVYHPAEMTRLKCLEVHRMQQDWNGILSLPYMRVCPTTLYACYQNLALAQKGELAEKLLDYPQMGSAGLSVLSDGSQNTCCLLSDINYLQGNIGTAQRMAFNAIRFQKYACTQMILRLIQTNLISGADKVAEKYITLLEKTLYYREQASAYRKFLGHPERVLSDPELGPRKKCMDTSTELSREGYSDLVRIAEANPQWRPNLEYLGCIHLLNQNQDEFQNFLSQYGQYLKPLPKSFIPQQP